MRDKVYLIIRSTYSLADEKPTGSDYKSVYGCLAYDDHEAASVALQAIKNIKGLKYEYDQSASDVLPYKGCVDWKELGIREVFEIVAYPVWQKGE